MRPELKVSISAKLEHAPKLMAMKHDGFHLNSRWIPLEAAGATNRLRPVTHWQQENFDDIAMAHFHMLYLEAGDDLKGALWETGWAAGRGKRIWIAGDGRGIEIPIPNAEPVDDHPPMMLLPHRGIMPWAQYRQQVRIVMTTEQAFKEMNAITNGIYTTRDGGGLLPPPDFFNL